MRMLFELKDKVLKASHEVNRNGFWAPLSLSGKITVACSILAILILAFLILFGIIQSCSPSNISIFMSFLDLDIFLVFMGVGFGAVGLRKTPKLKTAAILLLIIYAALLVVLLQLLYS
jgi:hypothetical protein